MKDLKSHTIYVSRSPWFGLSRV